MASKQRDAVIVRIMGEIGAQPSTEPILRMAFQHRSWANEWGGTDQVPEKSAANERLEFLGDSVLGVVIAERLYHRFPGEDEGRMSKVKARLVSAPILARHARELGLGPALQLGHGEELTGGRDRISLLANAMEAVIGAIYLGEGLDPAKRFILKRWNPDLELEAQDAGGQDFKSLLQEASQHATGELPEYKVEKISGPDHHRQYEISVSIGNRVMGSGQGWSKKEAAQAAAAQALGKFQSEHHIREEA